LGLLSLDDPDCENPAIAGNKGANLAVLRRAGFNVPPGIVLPTGSVDGNGDELPAWVASALARLPALLAPGPWAVRSSSTDEDSENASFAGQFETSLDVGIDGLAEAVLSCLRSGHSAGIEAYAGRRHRGSLAVLIQPMIAADVAGVAFTADPVSGQRQMIIEAVEGLGEGLVSGAADPERWTVAEDDVVEAPTTPTVLEADSAQAIAGLARRVEAYLGGPQDIEWAIADGTLWLLQARPITGLPNATQELIPIRIEVPAGYWERDDFHEPTPISPFGRVVLTKQILDVFPRVFTDFGILLDRVEVAFIGGWIYRQGIPLGVSSSKGGVRRPPPRWLLRILMRTHPAIRRRTRAARKVMAADVPIMVIRRWFDEWRPEHQEDIDRALSLDLGSLSDDELADELDHRLDVIGHPAHVVVAIAYWILVYELTVACRDFLEWEPAKMLGLLEGLSPTSTDPARELANLTRIARSKPATREVIANADETTPDRLAEVDLEFAQALEDYLKGNGHRSLVYDVIEPTLAETPVVLLHLVVGQLEVGFSPEAAAQQSERRREQITNEARSLLSSRPKEDRERFERALGRAREAYPAFEDRVWWTLSVQAALLRYLALEIGGRLMERGQLENAEDVFFLEEPEARAALLDGAGRRETARVAQGQRAWAKANPGPHSYGDPPAGEPPFDLLPPPARLVNQAMLWGSTQLFGERRSEGEAVVAGAAASSGRYTGTVRVVMGEHDFGKIRVGDVVVCPVTSPAWSVMFPSMGALVTDGGGILSHPAIIAREYRIPAVVGTSNATRVLEDGQRVTVDGDHGTVHLEPR
jgi:pyruvate,water dikinase